MQEHLHNEGCHITYARHETDHHCPPQFGAMYGRGLGDDGPYTFRFDYAPNKENDASCGSYDGFKCKEVAAGDSMLMSVPRVMREPKRQMETYI